MPSKLNVEATPNMHPAQRFQAPSGIQSGVPLKEIFGVSLIELIADSLVPILPSFQRRPFLRQAKQGIDDLSFNERARHIGRAMAAQLPRPFSAAGPVLIASLGPKLESTERNGLAPFFYFPHACVIEEFGIEDFDVGMVANYELTQRMTAEFCIRPFLVKYRDRTLKQLDRWTIDSNPHVRRLVSEGTRPRLPWAMRLKEFQNDPDLGLPLLEKLKYDPELYVRRSVANHLGDLLKDHPVRLYEVCIRWLEENEESNRSLSERTALKWIVRHAVRLPAKKGEAKALELRRRAQAH